MESRVRKIKYLPGAMNGELLRQGLKKWNFLFPNDPVNGEFLTKGF